MSSSWSEITLDDVCSKITDGAHHSPKSVETGKPMASVKDMTPFGLNLDSARLIGEEDYEKLVKLGCKPEIDDILIAKDGNSALDTVCRVKENKDVVLLSSVAILRPDTDVIYPDFLRLYLDAEPTRKYLKASSISGAAIPRVILKDFKRAKIRLPLEIAQQKIIADTVANYDNLIENNNRRIAILEDMAQSLYQEWFVKFRFPGHQNTKFKESSLGLIPEGWEIKAASKVIDIAPKMSLPKAGKKPFVSMPNVSTTSMVVDEIEMREGNSGTKFINGDTLMARITPCLQNGKTGFVQFLDDINPIGFGSTEFIVMRSKELPPEFVYCLARSDSFRGKAINSMAGADGRQRVKNDCFNSYYLPVPPKINLEQFSEIAMPAFKAVFRLNQKNKNLKKQRDMLLPKLISGNIGI
ncbi:MAG: restriction endonuclease subunit S [Woeseiaceae bacterium]